MRRRLERLRILVVEDHDDSREFLRLLLLRHGADVVAVATAEEGLALHAALRYDVIVSDLKLPEMDGCELLAGVRALERGLDRAAYAVAYSAERSPQVCRALHQGFDCVVSKPQVERLVALLGFVAATLRTE